MLTPKNIQMGMDPLSEGLAKPMDPFWGDPARPKLRSDTVVSSACKAWQ